MDNLIAVNTHKCVACRTCELECAVSHSKSKKLYTAIFEEPPPRKRIFVEKAGETNFPIQCRHCEDPPCKKVCPTDAFSKPSKNDPVLIDNDKCIGCKYCLIACPFGVITYQNNEEKIIKCDLCTNLEDNNPPTCVKSCPTNALEYIPSNELAKKKRGEFMVEFVDNR